MSYFPLLNVRETRSENLLRDPVAEVWPVVGSCLIEPHPSQEPSKTGSIVCPLLEMLVVTFGLKLFLLACLLCFSPLSNPGPPQPVLQTHSIFFHEVPSQDKLAELSFSSKNSDVVSRLATVRVIQQVEVCCDSLVARVLLKGSDGLSVPTRLRLVGNYTAAGCKHSFFHLTLCSL